MPITKARIDWSPEQVAELTRLYHDGLPIIDISKAIRVSESSIKVALTRFKLAQGKNWRLRKDGIVRRYWPLRTPGSIGQSFRFPVTEVCAIARRLKLGAEAPSNKHPRRPSRRIDPARMTWACRNRHTCPEASLVWDMIRGAQGLPPIGKGYAA
jgi:hypothetical protein